MPFLCVIVSAKTCGLYKHSVNAGNIYDLISLDNSGISRIVRLKKFNLLFFSQPYYKLQKIKVVKRAMAGKRSNG